MKVLQGIGFNDSNYKLVELLSLDKTKEKNLNMFVNLPNRVGANITNQDFSHLRFIYIDIDPNETIKQMINYNKNWDWKSWNQKVDRQIENLIKLFNDNYGKEPTYIFNSGSGIQLLLELDKPKSKSNIKVADMISYGFIFKFIELFLSEDFEIDLSIYDIADKGSFWSRIAPHKCKVPTKQTIIKKSNKGKIKYKSKIYTVQKFDTTFKLNEMIVPDYNFLSENVYKWQKEVKSASKDNAITDICTVLLKDGGKDKITKISNVRCLLPSHTDKSPSAVFFKDSGIMFCSSCRSVLSLNETYNLVTGEELNLSDTKIMFKDLADYLTMYSVSKENGFTYRFVTPKSQFKISILEWNERDLIKIISENFIVNYKPKLKNIVLDNITTKCDNREVQRVVIDNVGFYNDRIILSNKYSYKKNKYPVLTEDGEKIYKERFGLAMNIYMDEELNVDHTLSTKEIYQDMEYINNKEFNANVFSIIYSSLMMEVFEKSYKLHPLFYIYGFRDTGKTSLVEFALSLISSDFSMLVPGVSSTYTLLMSLSNKVYIPVLIDEASKFLNENNQIMIQMLKDIATNGGNHIKGKPQGIDKFKLKATPVLVNEYRVDGLDPSFFQRCIEIDLNIYDKINLNKAAEFNELLLRDKTSILLDMIREMENYSLSFKQVESKLVSLIPDYIGINGKKRFSILLFSTGVALSYNFMRSKGFKISDDDMDKHLIKYVTSEMTNNSSTGRKKGVAESIIMILESNIKFKYSLIESRISIKVVDREVFLYTSVKTLESLGWKNIHTLSEVRVKSSRVYSLSKRQFGYTIKTKIETGDALNILDKLMMSTDNITAEKNERDLINKIEAISKGSLIEEELGGL